LEGRFNPVAVRKYAAENFSVERMVREYADLYREIGSKSGRKSMSLAPLNTVEFVPEASLESALQNLGPDIAALADDTEDPQAVA
jgi:hypothetical protein